MRQKHRYKLFSKSQNDTAEYTFFFLVYFLCVRVGRGDSVFNAGENIFKSNRMLI